MQDFLKVENTPTHHRREHNVLRYIIKYREQIKTAMK